MNKAICGTLTLHYLSILERYSPAQEPPFCCGCITIYHFVNPAIKKENLLWWPWGVALKIHATPKLKEHKSQFRSGQKSIPVPCHWDRSVTYGMPLRCLQKNARIRLTYKILSQNVHLPFSQWSVPSWNYSLCLILAVE